MLLMFSYLGVNAQVNFDTTLLKDNSVILYTLDEYDRIVSGQFLESYNNLQVIEMQESSTSNDFGEEVLLDYVHFPSPDKGTKPLAFCFNQQAHKYYVYGGNKVLVYNSLNNEFLSSITVAESQFLIDYLYPKSKSIVFDDSESKLIVITADNTLVYIDSNTDQIINTIDLGEYYEGVFQSIYLNKNDNVLYVTLSFRNSGNSILKKFNINGDLLDEYVFNELLIYDLEIIDDDRIYVSAGGDLGGLYKINTSNLSDYELIKAGWFTEMVFAVNEQKLFCPNALTNAVEIVSLEFDQYCCKISNVLGYAFDGAYNSIDGYVYLTGKIGNDFTRITIDTESEETFPEMQFAMGIHWQQWNETNSALYWTTLPDAFGNNILKYQYGNLPNSQTGAIIPAKGFNRELGFNPDLEEVVCLNINNGLIESFDKNLIEKSISNITGGLTTRAAFNSINNKIYLIDTDQKSGNNLVAVYQADNGNLLNEITIVGRPKNMLYLEETNKLYITSNSKYLYTIDGINNNITDSVYLGYSVGEILMYDGVSIWVNIQGVEDKLVKINPTTLQKSYIDIGLNSHQLVNGISGFIYLFAGESGQYKVCKINKSTGIVWEKDVPEYSFVMSCPLDSSMITINQDNHLIKLDQNGNQQNDTYDLKFYKVEDALYYPKDNSIVFRTRYENENNLIKLNADNLSLIESKTLPSAYYQKMVLNTRNDRIYLHSYFEFSDFRSKMLAFNPSDLELVGSLNIGPRQSLINRSPVSYIVPKLGMFGETMANIPINNQMLIANIDFSSYSLVQCPEEERSFKNGWNWVSFPKLERTEDDPVDLAPLLNTMEPMPNQMLVQHRLNTENNPMTWANYNQGTWTFNQLEDLQSTKGYKIEITDENDEFRLPTPGTRLDPSYPISLAGNMVENWIGYYEYQSASDPFEALAFCLDNLRMIKMQNWSAFYGVIGIAKGIPIYGWTSVKPRPVKYGDMMIVQGINDCELIWNQAPKPGGKDLAEARYFEYEEQADYTTVFIELDENTDVQEIGAFVGESCVGATVVEEGDSLVEIQTYLQGAEGDEMYFQTYSPNKSAPTNCPDYYVKDFNTLQYVNRKIRPYDKKPFHMVSFKNEVIENKDDLIVYHYPNPANEEVNIRFNLQEKQQVTLELMDINGKLIEKIDLGSYPMGTNEYSYKIPQTLSNGVYLYKFITENTTVVNQLVIQ